MCLIISSKLVPKIKGPEARDRKTCENYSFFLKYIKSMSLLIYHALLHMLQPFTSALIVLLKKERGKDQESTQSSTTPDPGYHMRK